MSYTLFLCRSGELKDQYETAKTDVKKAEEETQFNFTKKKGIAAEKKEARVAKEEADKYQKLSQQMVRLYIHVYKLDVINTCTQ